MLPKVSSPEVTPASRETEGTGSVAPVRSPDPPTSGLQQTIGNSMVLATGRSGGPVVSTASSSSSGSGGVPHPEGGDKLAFEPAKGPLAAPYSKQIALIGAIVEKARIDKRNAKTYAELRKESEIARNEEVATSEDQRIKLHKKTLAAYHDFVRAKCGWNWGQLRADIGRAITGATFVESMRRADGRVYGSALVRVDEQVIYTVWFGEDRFHLEPDATPSASPSTATASSSSPRTASSGSTGPSRVPVPGVFTKKGYQGDSRKEFVEDVNKVKTHRYVTRAFNLYHLAAMFGLKLLAPTADQGETEPSFTGQERAQLPRQTDPRFGPHAETFDIRSAATYAPTGRPSPEFGSYRWTKVSAPGERTRWRMLTGTSPGRKATDPMSVNERASMQVRNGSGDGQPFLSTAAVQSAVGSRPEKVIRANKGERFDTGPENQGVVKIDLTELQKRGLTIVNQHADESHQYKIAYDRYYPDKEIEALRKKATAGTLSPKDLRGFNDRAVAAILTNQPIAAQDRPIKRTATEELDEYIYSARKNREVLIDKVPIECVVEIRLSGDEGKWPNLIPELPRDKWVTLEKWRAVLRAYVWAYPNVLNMWSAQQKALGRSGTAKARL